MKLLWILLITLSPLILQAWARQEKCGKHICARGAVCRDNHCHCRKQGRGEFFCYNGKKNDACFLIKDPHVVNYNKEKGFFPLPCRHQLTHVKTKSKCNIQVFGMTALKNAILAYEVSTELRIKVGNKRARIVLDSEREKYFIVRTKGTRCPVTRKGLHTVKVGKTKFTVRYNKKHEAWVVRSAACGFRMMFRPPVIAGDFPDETRIPGVVVVNSKCGAKFRYKDSDFRDGALCSTPRDPEAMKRYQEENNLDSINLAIIHSWLSSGLEQGFLDSCQALMDDFGNVCQTPQQKTMAVNLCGPMFDTNRGRNRACFNQDDQIVPYFKSCLTAVCSQGRNGRCQLAARFKNLGCRLEGLGNDCPAFLP